MIKQRQKLASVFLVLLIIVVFWYVMCVVMNAAWAKDKAQRQDQTLSFSALVLDTWAQDKPKLPAPHQVAVEIWKTTLALKITSKKSLIYHSYVTLSATLFGFALGVGLGILLAIGIVYFKVMDKSIMPWIIASQTIPILAIAPMIIVVLNAIGIAGLLPKAIISMYLSFFPVVVGMVKGLRSPDQLQLDQMHTWHTTATQNFRFLRFPSALPYFFTSLKIAMAAALVGAIVGELPTGAIAGLARACSREAIMGKRSRFGARSLWPRRSPHSWSL